MDCFGQVFTLFDARSGQICLVAMISIRQSVTTFINEVDNHYQTKPDHLSDKR